MSDPILPIFIKVRNYLHFDRSRDVFDVIYHLGEVDFVPSHSFMPFISYDIVSKQWDKEKKCKDDKVRTVCYASHRDSAIYQYYSQVLSENYERLIERYGCKGAIAYRPLGLTNIDFALEAFNEIKKMGACVVHALDLKDFFGSLDHKILKERWALVLNDKSALPEDHYAVFRSLTNYASLSRDDVFNVLGYGKRKQKNIHNRICSIEEFKIKAKGRSCIKVNRSGKGIVQGSPISAVLSNVYMIEFDRRMENFCIDRGAYYRRYSDDIMIVCNHKDESDIYEKLSLEVAAHKIMLHPNKCKKINIEPGEILKNPVQYLGFIFDGRKILIRSSSIARYWRKMKFAVRRRKMCAKHSSIKGGSGEIFRKSLFKKYTRFGRKENFPHYVESAQEKIHEQGISKQIRKQEKILRKFLSETY